MRVATATRVDRVAVALGVMATVAVGVGEGVEVAVKEGTIVKVAVAETVISGCLLSLSVDAELPNSRYTKTAPVEATIQNIPMMNNRFFTPNLMQ